MSLLCLCLAMGKSVKKLLIGSLAKKSLSSDVYQQRCYITYDYCFTMLGSYRFILMQEEWNTKSRKSPKTRTRMPCVINFMAWYYIALGSNQDYSSYRPRAGFTPAAKIWDNENKWFIFMKYIWDQVLGQEKCCDYCCWLENCNITNASTKQLAGAL